MGIFDAIRKGIPGRDAGATQARPTQQQQAPRPTLVQGGPAYFTPEGYRPPMQPQQAFMPTDTMGDPIGDMFRRQLPPVRGPSLPKMPPPDIPPYEPPMCFVAGTKIDMADGTKKVIENIAMGDEVLALNGETDVVSYVHDIPKADRNLWTINNRITATDAHAFLTNDGWKSNNSKLSNTVYNDYGIEVKELQLGDKLITKDGIEEVTKLESEKDFIKVYNFTTSNTHTYMVDGVVSHNKMPPIDRDRPMPMPEPIDMPQPVFLGDPNQPITGGPAPTPPGMGGGLGSIYDKLQEFMENNPDRVNRGGGMLGKTDPNEGTIPVGFGSYGPGGNLEISEDMRNKLGALDMDSIFNGGLDFANINNIPAPIQEPIDMPQPPSRPQLPADFNPAAGIPGSGVPPLGNPGDFRDGLPSVTDFDNRFSPSQLDDMRDKYRPEQELVVPPMAPPQNGIIPIGSPDPRQMPPPPPPIPDNNYLPPAPTGPIEDLRGGMAPVFRGELDRSPFTQEVGTDPNAIDVRTPDSRTIAPPREIPREIAPPMAPPKRIAPPSFEREPREMPREAPIQAPTPPAQIEQIKQVLPQLPQEQLMDILPQLPPEVIQELPEELIRQIMPMMPEPMMPEPMQPRMQMPGPIATPTPRLQRPSLPMMPMMGGRGRR